MEFFTLYSLFSKICKILSSLGKVLFIYPWSYFIIRDMTPTSKSHYLILNYLIRLSKSTHIVINISVCKKSYKNKYT